MIAANYQIPEAGAIVMHHFPSGAEVPEMLQRMELPRMASINEAAEMSGVPAHLIRTLALEGKIPAIRAGSKKIWINVDGLAKYLAESHI